MTPRDVWCLITHIWRGRRRAFEPHFAIRRCDTQLFNFNYLKGSLQSYTTPCCGHTSLQCRLTSSSWQSGHPRRESFESRPDSRGLSRQSRPLAIVVNGVLSVQGDVVKVCAVLDSTEDPAVVLSIGVLLRRHVIWWAAVVIVTVGAIVDRALVVVITHGYLSRRICA